MIIRHLRREDLGKLKKRFPELDNSKIIFVVSNYIHLAIGLELANNLGKKLGNE